MTSAPNVLLALLIGTAVFLAATEHQEWSNDVDGPVLNSIRVDRINRRVKSPRAGTSQPMHRRLTLHGRGFGRVGGGPRVNFRFNDGRNVASPLIEWQSDHRVVAWVPENCRGTARVELRNPDGRRTSLIVDL